MRITVKEIAEKLGVSFQLVSAVLNGKTYCRASAEKKKLILETARAMGYYPNDAARIMTGKPSRIFGLLMKAPAASPAYLIQAELEAACSASGFRILTASFSVDAADAEKAYISLKRYGAEGIFILHVDEQEFQPFLRKLAKDPVVMIDCAETPSGFHVRRNFTGAMEKLLTCFRNGGKKKVHYLTRPAERYFCLEERLNAFLAHAPAEKKRTHLLTGTLGDPGIDGIPAAQWLAESVGNGTMDGIIVQDDLWALSLMKQAQTAGLRLPEDLGVAGFNNDPFAALLIPELTTVGFSPRSEALSALQRMKEAIAGEPEQNCVIEFELYERNSIFQQGE